MAEGDDDKPFVLPLLDGRVLSLPMSRIRPTLQALLELWAGGGIDADSGKIGFSRLDAADLAALEERTGLVWRGGESLRDLGRLLRQSGGIPKAEIPDIVQGDVAAVSGPGGRLAAVPRRRRAGRGAGRRHGAGQDGADPRAPDDRESRRAAGSSVPDRLPDQSDPELAGRGRPFRAQTVGAAAARRRRARRGFGKIAKHDLVLSTYPLLTRDHEVLAEQEWHVVILDEAQSIKNPNAETTRQALRLKARQRLCLSGTPLQNHLGELWSLFDFLAPGFLGGQKSFKTRFRTPIEKAGDVERQDMLNRRIRPFMLRRTKEEVVTELPPKTEIVEPVEMEANQRAIYEAIRLSMHAKVQAAIAQKGLARSGIIILDALLKMRQACCDPRLLKLKTVARDQRPVRPSSIG